MRPDDTALVEQGQPSGGFQHPLNHEHHVGTARIVFVETQGDVVLVGPRQNAVAELGHLQAVADDDGILADQVDTADVAVEVDAHARPVETGRHLLDVGRFAGAVVPGDDDSTIVREAGEDGERRRLVEPVIGIDIRDMLIGLRIGRHLHVAVETEELADRHLHVGEAGDLLGCGGHCSSRDLGNDRDPFRSMEWCGFGREFSRKPRARERRRAIG